MHRIVEVLVQFLTRVVRSAFRLSEDYVIRRLWSDELECMQMSRLK